MNQNIASLEIALKDVFIKSDVKKFQELITANTDIICSSSFPEWLKLKILKHCPRYKFIELAYDLASKIRLTNQDLSEDYLLTIDIINYYSKKNIDEYLRKVSEVGQHANLLTYRSLFRNLRRAIETHSAYSYVRIGDGEGNFIAPSSKVYKLASSEWQAKMSKLQFGDTVRAGFEANQISESIKQAVESADVLGIMRPERLIKIINERELPFDRQLAGNIENYLFVHESTMGGSSPLSITDSSVNYDPDFSKQVVSFACETGRKIGIIGPHLGVVKYFRDKGVKDVSFYPIPGENKYFPGDLPHYPDYFQWISYRLSNDNLEGTIFFVGGGLLGKYYCHLVKMNGGVAIDIGSLMDRLAGYENTRKTKKK